MIPIGLGLLRSPVTLQGALAKNGPLTNEDKCRLEAMADKLRGEDTRKSVYETIWNNNVSCEKEQPPPTDVFSTPVEFDHLQDLYEADTLVFVALSGGGVRAAALAQHALTLLERKYNEFRGKAVDKPPLVEAIHAISSVSGGSLLAYRLARAKTLIENEQNHLPELIHSGKEAKPRIPCLESDSEPTNKDLSNLKQRLFDCLDRARLGLTKQGLYASAFYLGPGNLLTGPLLTFLTDETYLSIL